MLNTLVVKFGSEFRADSLVSGFSVQEIQIVHEVFLASKRDVHSLYFPKPEQKI